MHVGPAPAAHPSASAELVAQLRPVLVKYFERRCGDSAEAEDLAQEVIMRALAQTGWASAEHAKAYVFRIAANLWKDRGRRLAVRGVPVPLDDVPARRAREELSPERVFIAREELRRIAAALGELGERTRAVFMLHRLERMKQREIAAALGVSVSSVEKHMAKALAHLARRIDDDDHD